MNTIETIRSFFGWCAIINIGLLTVTTISIITLQRFIISFHSKIFKMDEKDLFRAYFQYLAQYKIAVIVLNIVPYIALKLMN